MQIMTAIQEADALCPNPYTLSEKLLWCDEVSAAVRREVLKTYDTISVTWDGVQPLLLPDDICFEDIEALYANGQLMEKSDFRTVAKHALQYFGTGFSCPTELRAVYLTKPAPIREIEIRGTFNTNEDFIAMEAPLLPKAIRFPLWYLRTRTQIRTGNLPKMCLFLIPLWTESFWKTKVLKPKAVFPWQSAG